VKQAARGFLEFQGLERLEFDGPFPPLEQHLLHLLRAQQQAGLELPGLRRVALCLEPFLELLHRQTLQVVGCVLPSGLEPFAHRGH